MNVSTEIQMLLLWMSKKDYERDSMARKLKNKKKKAEEILKKKRLAKKVALGTAAVVGTGIADKKKKE